MPCQDTLFLMRYDSDPAFANACQTDTAGDNAMREAFAELCRVGGMLASGEPIASIRFTEIPATFLTSFGDDWGERIRERANHYIAQAHEANGHLADIAAGNLTPAARTWLVRHWEAELAFRMGQTERHKRELTLPRYARPGPKHDKRVKRIAEDEPMIALLEARIAWATH